MENILLLTRDKVIFFFQCMTAALSCWSSFTSSVLAELSEGGEERSGAGEDRQVQLSHYRPGFTVLSMTEKSREDSHSSPPVCLFFFLKNSLFLSLHSFFQPFCYLLIITFIVGLSCIYVCVPNLCCSWW